MLRPLAGFWFLNKSLCMHQQQDSGSFGPLAGSPISASPVATGEVVSNASRWGMAPPLITYARFHQHSESHQPQQYPVLPVESLHTH